MRDIKTVSLCCFCLFAYHQLRHDGLMAGALVTRSSGPGSSTDRRHCAGCVLGQDTLPSVHLSTQVYKWIPENLMLGVSLRWTSIPSRGGGGKAEKLLVTSYYRNWDKLRPDGRLGSYADSTLPTVIIMSLLGSLLIRDEIATFQSMSFVK